MTWEFTDIEFKVLCNLYREGAIPSPLVYTSRTMDHDVYDRELLAAQEDLDRRLDSHFRAVFEAVCNPEVFVGVHGWHDADIDNPAKHLVVHGARRGRRACVLIQKPGETTMHSGGVTMLECEPEELAALLVAQLPPAEPGQSTVIPIATEPAPPDPYEAPRASAFDTFEESVDTRSLRFFSTPADQTGAMQILQGRSKYGPRGVAVSTLVWRDLPGDGRYLIDLDPEVKSAVGVDNRRFIEHLDGVIGQILMHMEARGEQQEYV
ncbi:ESX secretion-associated protein EspG [Nocardia sp. CDC160]|uniref:ESX secretion-associated protein EspG n=1 Tax=Nocardia sp. CDC160 TaxID=3112166 RepID=UPI002DB66BA0|nr:ESX secretion-associated protein EspG [Nocardia sp. CDC160]MEC3913334.1 ESX secretion-associated protein EspG [Nocardia sp. CDC160]